VTPDRALLIAHARLLGATYRRIAELFGGSTIDLTDPLADVRALVACCRHLAGEML
jgi:hypothetical protein